MDDGKLSPGIRLDWQQVGSLVMERFSEEDREILYRLYGIEGHSHMGMKELRKFTKLNKKKFEEKIKNLENKLFRFLKDQELEDLFIEEPSQD